MAGNPRLRTYRKPWSRRGLHLAQETRRTSSQESYTAWRMASGCAISGDWALGWYVVGLPFRGWFRACSRRFRHRYARKRPPAGRPTLRHQNLPRAVDGQGLDAQAISARGTGSGKDLPSQRGPHLRARNNTGRITLSGDGLCRRPNPAREVGEGRALARANRELPAPNG